MKFIVDTQLLPRLSHWLSEKGFDATHTIHYEKAHLLSDSEIIEIAIEENRIIISKDSDFAEHYFLKGAPPAILLLTFGNVSNNVLVNAFETHIPAIVETIQQGSEFVIFSHSEIIGY